MKWSEFIENPQSNKDPQSGVMMIILQRDIRPQPVFNLLYSGQNFNPSDYGYAMSDGKVQREGSVYLSEDMMKLKCWCEQYGIKHSFDFFADEIDGGFMDGEYLQMSGNFTLDAINSFPLKYHHMFIRGASC